MTPKSIKALLMLRNLEYADVLARMRKNGVICDKTELSKTINGERDQEKIREAFAAALGMKQEEVFDAEFDAVVGLKRTA